ncbi:MAG: 50S ribosomal protein L22 [Candidatus Liptonbacteria bacterium RIFOXYC1_FULL_36_8]|uniref:Large ribosomal subunit protein uL22 n=3 Tax=Candidatus Liptoniibacteriota TaxID=1817909 RepID=A0A1G2CPY9_9BACT|nr:MAG: 50S ribosomal protein L22 [Candidatus Liptonbacteria bacterium RIFOXYB1_FULL_36_10]OGZ04125.1 MAG: 50S ribosomal protein L22 [Candidatus Liptonbacteria bacterium RIFOXYC1_FULL_36_8]OGZ04546.1 MAG: 50S ribosomal protein L22 [Candidatus Liptonbacteria bacterium RIFOXYD1_FULL_36_11]
MAIQKAQLNYLKMAPRKVRLITGLVKGMNVNDAEAELLLSPNRAAKPVLKLVQSAVSNAKNNKKMNGENLFIKSITVDGGPMLKRYLPRARGSASPIQRKSSHITVILEERETKIKPKFNFIEKKKKEKKEDKKPTRTVSKLNKKNEEIQEKAGGEKKERGIFKRFFRRKTV